MRNIEGRLRHPVHVVTRRILYGNVHATTAAVDYDTHTTNDNDSNNNNNNNINGNTATTSIHNTDNLEALFNDDDAEIKEGPESVSRRSAARMEAFLASCAVALRDEEEEGHDAHPTVNNKGGATSATSNVKISGENNRSISGVSGSISHRGVVGNGTRMDKKKLSSSAAAAASESSVVVSARARSNSSSCKQPKRCRQIDMGDLLLRLEVYCRT